MYIPTDFFHEKIELSYHSASKITKNCADVDDTNARQRVIPQETEARRFPDAFIQACSTKRILRGLPFRRLRRNNRIPPPTSRTKPLLQTHCLDRLKTNNVYRFSYLT